MIINREMRFYLSILLTALAISTTETSKAAAKVRIKGRSPVYFPVIPVAELDDNFGSKVAASSVSHSRRVPASFADNVPPLSVHKLTTTTEKLPLAQESHYVVDNTVTQAPGPTYLTDSLYYIGDPTPDPNIEDDDYHLGYSDIFDFGERDENEKQRDREEEGLGVYLQSISTYEPQQFSQNRDSFDLLSNPAKMHFIPPNSGENDDEDILGNQIEAGNSEQYIPSSDNSSSPLASTDEQKSPFPVSTNGNSKSINRVALQTSTTPVPILRTPLQTTTPETDVATVFESKTPVIRYNPTTVAPRVIRIKPELKKSAPVNPFIDSSKSLFVKSSEMLRSKPLLAPAAPFFSTQPRFSVSSLPSSAKSSPAGYLPKPASNPFALRISKPVVEPIYNKGNQIEVSQFPSPSNNRHFSTQSTMRQPQNPAARESAAVTKSNLHNLRIDNSRERYFGERKPKSASTVEIYRPPLSTVDQDVLFESRKRDYGFDFNSAAGSAPKRQYRPPSVTVTPISGAPVYRTSTKSFRAPSSLFPGKGAIGKVGKPVTAPSQPDFIEADANIYVPQEYDENAIPGVGGVDYPNYSSIPITDFSCKAQEHPGLYADEDTSCQVFHICQEGGREDSFLCPNGTVFNQQYFVCDWWYNFSCESADRFYHLNALLYELPDSIKFYS